MSLRLCRFNKTLAGRFRCVERSSGTKLENTSLSADALIAPAMVFVKSVQSIYVKNEFHNCLLPFIRLSRNSAVMYKSGQFGQTVIMKKFIQNFISCGLLGWCMEILFTSFDSYRRRDLSLSGRTSVWMFPIYGTAAALAPISRMLKGRNFIFRGLVYTGIIFTCEFFSGSLLCKKGICPWNYESSRWNVKNVIRLDYAPCWFIMGLLFERLLTQNDEI